MKNNVTKEEIIQYSPFTGPQKKAALVRLQVSEGQEISTQEFTLEVEITTGLLDKEKKEHMLIYPNPTKGRLNIELGNITAQEKE